MVSSIKSFINRPQVLWPVASVLIIAFYFPYISSGENSHILVHDNLDSNVAWVKILLDSGLMFAPPQELVPQVFNGIPRSALYGNYDISLLWFYLFGMYEGYIINKIIMALVGFIGMHLLLTRHLFPKGSSTIVIFTVSLMYALLPFWSFTLSVSGLPLIAYVFLNLRKKEARLSDWLLITGFTFYSSLVLSGVFFISILIFILLYDAVRAKKLNFTFLKGILLLCGCYVISHYPLFYSFIFKGDYVSHRVSFVQKPWSSAIGYKRFDEIIRYGQYHAYSLHTHMIIPILAILPILVIRKKLDKRYLFCLLFVLLTSLIYGYMKWVPVFDFTNWLSEVVPLQIQRFHFLHPLAWYILLALALFYLSKYGIIGKLIVFGILIFQLHFIIQHHGFLSRPPNRPSYQEFYAESLFTEVKDFIDRPTEDYRVISIGMHPAIAQYNGFYTLDGYFPNYPLKHKLKFREVIAPELEKNSVLKNYYDSWGSRCYALNNALKRFFLNPNVKLIKELDFNFGVLNEMGGHYILSAGEIDTKNVKSLQLEGVFEHPDSFWKIYLYKNLAPF